MKRPVICHALSDALGGPNAKHWARLVAWVSRRNACPDHIKTKNQGMHRLHAIPFVSPTGSPNTATSSCGPRSQHALVSSLLLSLTLPSLREPPSTQSPPSGEWLRLSTGLPSSVAMLNYSASALIANLSSPLRTLKRSTV